MPTSRSGGAVTSTAASAVTGVAASALSVSSAVVCSVPDAAVEISTVAMTCGSDAPAGMVGGVDVQVSIVPPLAYAQSQVAVELTPVRVSPSGRVSVSVRAL